MYSSGCAAAILLRVVNTRGCVVRCEAEKNARRCLARSHAAGGEAAEARESDAGRAGHALKRARQQQRASTPCKLEREWLYRLLLPVRVSNEALGACNERHASIHFQRSKGTQRDAR